MFRRMDLAARQGRYFEDLLEAKGRRRIRLFRRGLRFLCLPFRGVVLIQVFHLLPIKLAPDLAEFAKFPLGLV
jgi:hypothetical protein